MKKRLITLLTTAFCMGYLSVSAQAVLKFEKTSHNFGTFAEDTPVTYKFVFSNTGDKPLVIQQAMSSCGCTIANYTKTPIQPGKNGEVNVTYNGKGKYPGHFKKAITIRSNATNKLVRLYIEGDMTEKK